MTIPDETLVAFVDGLLPDAEALRVADAIDADPVLADRVALLAEGRDAARGAFRSVLDEAVPERLLAAARAAPQPVAGNDNAPRHWRVVALGIAASLAIGMFLGTLVPDGGTPGLLPPPVRTALDTAPTGGAGAVRILATHAVDGGVVCRSFAMPDAGGSMLGLACHEHGEWHLRAAVARREQAAFEPAGSGDPVIAEVLERLGGGPALSAEAEAAARGRGWRAPR